MAASLLCNSSLRTASRLCMLARAVGCMDPVFNLMPPVRPYFIVFDPLSTARSNFANILLADRSIQSGATQPHEQPAPDSGVTS
jgi:hypothetical protein